jgi:hypothetical protein
MKHHGHDFENFDKNFDGMFKTVKTGFAVTLALTVLGGIASLAFVGTIIYLLLKHFG